MELLRESAPFLFGALIAPVIVLVGRLARSEQGRFLGLLALALICGAGASLVNGELGHGLPESLMAIVIDASLVFTGMHVAYYAAWHSLATRRSVAGRASATATEAQR